MGRIEHQVVAAVEHQIRQRELARAGIVLVPAGGGEVVAVQQGGVRVLGVLAVDHQIGVESLGKRVALTERLRVVRAGVKRVNRRRGDG